ncbi:MAG: tRNA(Ile)-lysidine synthetase, partial [Mycobacterium sp.]
MDRTGALAALREAVSAFARRYSLGENLWCVALSGGPDSLALTAACAGMRPTTALIVDHGLQEGSAAVAETARSQALDLGCVEARVLRVEVG